MDVLLNAHIIWADLDRTVDPYDKKIFRFKWGATFFPKLYRFVNVLCKLRQESQIRAQLMTDTVCKKDFQRNYEMVSELSSWCLHSAT